MCIDDVPMDDMWREYNQEMDQIIQPLGTRQFRRVWEKHNGMKKFCHKRRRKPFGTCPDCTGYEARIHRNARDPNELLLVKTGYYEHLDMKKIERGIYYKHEGPATKSGLRNPPIKSIFISPSCGADQCGFN